MLGETSSSARVVAMADAMLRRSSYYAYIQDDWKITSKLTLNIGLRYEHPRPWHDKYRGIVNVKLFDPGVGPNGFLPNSKLPSITRPGEGDFYQGLNFHFADGQLVRRASVYGAQSGKPRQQFRPRLGLPTVPRRSSGTAASFYVQDSGNPVFDMARNQAGRDLFITNIEQRNASMSDPWAAERASASCTGWTGTCLVGPQILANIQNMRTPYVAQWLFNIQRELTQNLVLEVGYQGNEGHKLPRFRIFNQPILKTGPSDTRTVLQRTPWPTFGRIQKWMARQLQLSCAQHEADTAVPQGSHLHDRLPGRKPLTAAAPSAPTRRHAVAGQRLQPQSRTWVVSIQYRRRFVALRLRIPFGPGKPVANQGVISKIVGGW
jgi:hypothetical protein